jgi:hypothetical protein
MQGGGAAVGVLVVVIVPVGMSVLVLVVVMMIVPVFVFVGVIMGMMKMISGQWMDLPGLQVDQDGLRVIRTPADGTH